MIVGIVFRRWSKISVRINVHQTDVIRRAKIVLGYRIEI